MLQDSQTGPASRGLSAQRRAHSECSLWGRCYSQDHRPGPPPAYSTLNGPHPRWELPGRAGVFNNLHNQQLGEGFVDGLWGPGEFVSQRSSWNRFQKGRRHSRGLRAGLRRGRGLVWPAKPRNPGLGPPLPHRASPCYQFAVGFCAKSHASPGLSFPSCHMGSLVPSPGVCGHSGGNTGTEHPREQSCAVPCPPPAGRRVEGASPAPAPIRAALRSSPLPSRLLPPPPSLLRARGWLPACRALLTAL